MTTSRTHITSDAGVLTISVATAARGTSLSATGLAQGIDALHGAGSDDIGAIVLVGEGANFCAGGDVRAFADEPDRGEFVGDLAHLFHHFVRAITAVQAPVVAAVNGWAAGAGMSIVLHSDIALGTPSTKLRPAYPSIGFTPDGGMSWTLPRAVGPARAREILLTDAVLNADEAVRLGILSRLVPEEELQDEAMRVARSLVSGPTAAYARIRELLAESADRPLVEQLDAEAAAIAIAANSPTGIEGVNAFIEKRALDFNVVARR